MTPIFAAEWNDYEEGWFSLIYENNGKYYHVIDGHNVMNGDYSSHDEITEDEVWEIMEEDKDYETDVPWSVEEYLKSYETHI